MAIDLRSRYRYKVYDEDHKYIGDWTNVASLPKFPYVLGKYATGFSLDFAVNLEDAVVETQTLTTEAGETLTTEGGEELVAEIPSGVFLGGGGLLKVGYNVVVQLNSRVRVPHATSDDILRDEHGDPITDEHGDPIYITEHGRRPNTHDYRLDIKDVFRGYVARIRYSG